MKENKVRINRNLHIRNTAFSLVNVTTGNEECLLTCWIVYHIFPVMHARRRNTYKTEKHQKLVHKS